MENIILLVHLLTALAIIGLIMLQQGKGADMGASFGAGASQTLFGSGGSGNFFSRLTAVLATAFFATSFSLAVIAKNRNAVSDEYALPELEQIEAPAEQSDVPAVETDSDIPSLEEDAAASIDEAQQEAAADIDQALLDAAEASDDEVPAVPVE
ncbi:protein translocase subunit secG [Alteromonadaceae bacterium Bs31]|nr:protein translocase subunit secG [Alteromonadaceae bacterium Bs31]